MHQSTAGILVSINSLNDLEIDFEVSPSDGDVRMCVYVCMWRINIVIMLTEEFLIVEFIVREETTRDTQVDLYKKKRAYRESRLGRRRCKFGRNDSVHLRHAVQNLARR